MGKESKVFDVQSQGLIKWGLLKCFNVDWDPRRWGLRRYDDVGWPGAIFIAIAHAGCDRHTKG